MMKKIEKNAITALDYEGYLWYSNAERPEFINGRFDANKLDSHPFVVEGALYSKAENKSITIRCLDGEYYIYEANLEEIKAQEGERVKTIEHQWFVAKDKNKKATMLEVWTLSEDELSLCAKMPTFRPAFWVFKGFK